MYKTATFLLILLGLSTSLAAQSTDLWGFTPENAQRQLALEAKFAQAINVANFDTWMKDLAGKPHHVGSPHGRANAETMVRLLREWGWEAEIETFYVLFPTPKVRLVELVGPKPYKAKLAEGVIPGDPYTAQPGQLPTYNAFSADGDVTADLVFVNYGVPGDYEQLERMGIDVKGKIVIAKYGGSWRGIKPKVAAEHGAIGCIIYSDPEDDGYFEGDVYPEGAFKTPSGAQRGSVLDMPLYPGDPLTPNVGATQDAKRLERKDAPTLMKIPVLPISYEDAQPLLAALRGPVAPAAWRGGLPITYHIGPGPAKVHLKLEFDWSLQPAHNVIAKMRGSEFPDEWVIRGNHHDAWVHGASDPISGMVAVLEEARIIGELAKQGQRPKRTLVYCGWDAEEPGLLGSTEWVEFHADELRQKAVAYINSDGNGRGYLYAGGSHTLEKFFNQVARDVKDPQHGISVLERRRSASMVQGQDMSSLELSALGSGSDYTPFIQHLGIASMNIGFGGEGDGGEYHTNYDTYPHYTRFKDPGLAYEVALAETGGRTALRLANADLLPFDFQRFSRTVNQYAEDLMKMTDSQRQKFDRQNKLLAEGAYKYTTDPRQPLLAPKPKAAVPYLNFAPLQNALAELKQAADNYQVAASKANLTQAAQTNQLLIQAERALTREAGLPRRPWFQHHIYAPGFYTGYGVKTLPGIREAIEEEKYTEAQEQVQILADVLAGFTQLVNLAAAKLK